MTRINSTYSSFIDIGKMPPQAVEVEESILGELMLEKDCSFKAVQYLKPESFYKEVHQKIYRAILNLFDNKKEIDILTVTEELKKLKTLEEVGGPYYVSQLTSRVASCYNFEEHCLIVADKFKKREIIRVTSDIQSKSYDESLETDDIMNYFSAEMFKIEQEKMNSVIHVKDAINHNLKIIEQLSKSEIKFNGIPSGHTKLDRFTCGWQKTDLIILAGRPSMGKTAFALDLGKNAASFKHPVLFFSLEMNLDQLANRYISSETDYTNMELKTGRVSNWQQIEKCVAFFEGINIYIDDTPAITINQLRSKSYLYKNKFKIEMIIIDYLQLMRGYGFEKNREQEIANISRSLKVLAKELDIPVMALAQLNRMVESRSGSKRPQLSDLRESGSIEQDADLVIFINKPERYGILEDEDGKSTINLTEIIISKHRSGSVGEIRLKHNCGMSKFFDEDGNISTPDESIKPLNPDFRQNKEFNEEAPF